MIIGEEGVKGLLSLIRFGGNNNSHSSIEWAASSFFGSNISKHKVKAGQEEYLMNEHILGLRVSKDSEME